MTELVIVTDDGPVRTVRMNRPEKKNALTMAMYDAMAGAIESAAQNPALRRSCGFFTRWRAAKPRWSPPCRATRSASAPPC